MFLKLQYANNLLLFVSFLKKIHLNNLLILLSLENAHIFNSLQILLILRDLIIVKLHKLIPVQEYNFFIYLLQFRPICYHFFIRNVSFFFSPPKKPTKFANAFLLLIFLYPTVLVRYF